MEIEVYNVTNPKEFVESLSEQMTPYIKEKIYGSALRLIDDMAKYNENPRHGKQKDMNHIVYLSYEDNRIIGFLHYYYSPQRSSSNLFGVYVDNDYRLRSVADKMINKAIKFLIDSDKGNIEVVLAPNSDKEGPKYLLEIFFEKMKSKYPEANFNINKGL